MFCKDYVLSKSSCIISFLFIHAKVDMAMGHLQTQIFSWLWVLYFITRQTGTCRINH